MSNTNTMTAATRPFFKTGPELAKYLQSFARSQAKAKAGHRTRAISSAAAMFELSEMNPSANKPELLAFRWSLESDYR